MNAESVVVMVLLTVLVTVTEMLQIVLVNVVALWLWMNVVNVAVQALMPGMIVMVIVLMQVFVVQHPYPLQMLPVNPQILATIQMYLFLAINLKLMV